jgi:hypothetical protein
MTEAVLQPADHRHHPDSAAVLAEAAADTAVEDTAVEAQAEAADRQEEEDNRKNRI